MADKLETNVNKVFRLKGATGSAADRRFRVTQFTPSFDFGARKGGKKPAYHVQRLDAKGNFVAPTDQFHSEYEEVKEPQAA